MVFEYKEYYSSLVYSSLVFIIFAFIVLIIGVIIHIRPKFFGKMMNIDLGIVSFLIVIIVTTMITMIGVATINFDLMFEDEENREVLFGTISEVSSVDTPPKFTYQGTPVTPKYITIDNEKYYIMYIGDFAEGDKVVIEFLPKSKIVLSIFGDERIETTNE